VLGEIRSKRENGVLVAAMGLIETPLAVETGGAHISVVAGACFFTARWQIPYRTRAV